MKTLVLVEAATPIVLAAAVAAWGRWPVVRQGVRLALLMLALLATALAATTPAMQIALGATPWGSQVNLDFSAPASWLVALVFWGVALAHLPHRHMPLADGPPLRLGLALGLQGAIGAALLVDDLLSRVVALDLISLLVVALLLALHTSSSRPAVIWHYVTLCIGDMSFLMVALLLYALTGSMGVATAFGAAGALESSQLLLLVIAGLLAVWVKLGLTPFDGWLRAATRLPAFERALVLSVGPPLMAAYLLYRLRPALAALGGVGAALLWGGAALAAVAALMPTRRAAVVRSGIERALALHSALGLAAVGVGLLLPYLLTFAPLRAALCLQLRDRAVARNTARDAPGLPLPRGLAALVSVAARVDTALEQGVGALERAPQRLGALLQRAHTGKLRLNLLLALLALAPVLLAMFSALVKTP